MLILSWKTTVLVNLHNRIRHSALSCFQLSVINLDTGGKWQKLTLTKSSQPSGSCTISLITSTKTRSNWMLTSLKQSRKMTSRALQIIPLLNPKNAKKSMPIFLRMIPTLQTSLKSRVGYSRLKRKRMRLMNSVQSQGSLLSPTLILMLLPEILATELVRKDQTPQISKSSGGIVSITKPGPPS